MSVLAEFSIFPLDKGESVSEYVARVLKLIERSGINYVLTPMGTILEAESVEEIFNLIKRCHEELERDCNRIILNIRMDFRKGKSNRMLQKVKSVEEKVGKPLSSIKEG